MIPIEEIRAARERLAGRIVRTPLIQLELPDQPGKGEFDEAWVASISTTAGVAFFATAPTERGVEATLLLVLGAVTATVLAVWESCVSATAPAPAPPPTSAATTTAAARRLFFWGMCVSFLLVVLPPGDQRPLCGC